MSIFNTFADQIRAFSDADLLAAYERITGEPGNPEADALLAEIERRNLGL